MVHTSWNSAVNEEKSEFKFFLQYEEESYEEDDADNKGGVIIEISPTGSVPHDLNHSRLSPLVTKIREVLRIFRSSPTKMVNIYKIILQQNWAKKLSCNSNPRLAGVVHACKIFELRYCVQRALIDVY
jgi:hypothetical protein